NRRPPWFTCIKIEVFPLSVELLNRVNAVRNLSPGVANLGQLDCTSSGLRTRVEALADPNALGEDATAISRSFPVNCGRLKSNRATPSASVCATVDIRATGFTRLADTGEACRGSYASLSPPTALVLSGFATSGINWPNKSAISTPSARFRVKYAK